MNIAQLKASLALWTRREKQRKHLHTVAQQDLLEARAAGAQDVQIPQLIARRDLRSRQLKEARDNIKLRLGQIEIKEKAKVRRPHERINKQVKNQSSRNGAKITLIVIHSTESHNRPGVTDLEGNWNWFNTVGSGASSSVIVDDEGFSAQCVADANKAWTQAAYNPQSLSIEMIGFAAQGKKEWTEAQYKKTAQYLAYWSKKHDIPLVRSTTHGVTRHMDLGAAGGGHHDPGVNFDMNKLLAMARKFLANGW